MPTLVLFNFYFLAQIKFNVVFSSSPQIGDWNSTGVSMSKQTDGNANVVFSRLFLSLLRAHLVRPRPHCLECQHGVSGTLPRFVRICSHHVFILSIFSQTLPRWEIFNILLLEVIVCKQTLFCREKVTGDGPMFGLGNTKPPLFSLLCSFFALFSLSRCLFALFYTVFLAPSH